MAGLDRVVTPRLVGTRPAPADAAPLHAIMADERVAARLWPGSLGGPRTLAQVRGIIARDAAHFERHGYGPWTVRDRGDGTVAGRVGLARTAVAGSEETALDWLIAPERWGEGLATEMAHAALRAAFDVLGLDRVVAFTLPSNGASRAVMEKLGMAREAEIVHAGLPHVLYAVSRRTP